MAERRTFSNEQKAAAIAKWKVNGNNIKRTAREFDIDPSTLRSWIKNYEANPDPLVEKAVEEAQEQFVDDTKEIMHLLQANIKKGLSELLMSNKTYTTGDIKNLATSFGIHVDKLNLQQGKPTARIEKSNQLSKEDMKDILISGITEAINDANRTTTYVSEIFDEGEITDAEVISQHLLNKPTN